MTGKRALVLGVTGRIGSVLAKSLVQDDWRVYGAARLHSENAHKHIAAEGITPIRFDVTQDDPAGLPDVDVVFLEIWDPGQPALMWDVNFFGVGRVVERYAGSADIVNGSTINVYGDSPNLSSEETPPRPGNDYGRSRFAQEKLIDYFCWRGGKKGIHVRYAHANTEHAGLLRRMADTILAGKSLGPNPDARVQVITLEDAVRVTQAAVSRATCPPVAVNCCHPRVWTYRQLAETLQARLGRGEVIFDRESGGVEHSAYADVSRMLAWFGEPQVSLETMFERITQAVDDGQ
ncbi:MAG: NAD(P)-dependent oxidoreductase [Chloroflexota bacterium]|nr:NAD(P)-dependent oxidoreductase [Chloroflexota bacterium]